MSFQDNLATLIELNLKNKKELETSAELRQTYHDALERCTCILRDVVQDRAEKMKTCVPAEDACKLLRVLDETQAVFNNYLPSEDPLNHLDNFDNENVIREYIKEIHGF